ncbi:MULTISPECIES: hypothetical protein [Roseobacteraceae]|uniref:hypothetical protein n=1 Tax=Roseobacteraceae TaxID=2854170 RepID=UPI0031DCC727
MNNRLRVRTASAVGGGASIIVMMGIVTALIQLASWAGDRHRARRRANHQE